MSILIFILALGWHSERSLHGHHTEFCPPSHQRGELRSCDVLDRVGDRVLIEHAELDGNRVYIEIRTPRESHYLQLPSSVVRLAPEGYMGKLINGKNDAILFDGVPTPLKPLEEPTF